MSQSILTREKTRAEVQWRDRQLREPTHSGGLQIIFFGFAGIKRVVYISHA